MAISGYRGQQTQAVCGGSNVRDPLHTIGLPKGYSIPIGFNAKKDNCVLPTSVNWTLQEFGKVLRTLASYHSRCIISHHIISYNPYTMLPSLTLYCIMVHQEVSYWQDRNDAFMNYFDSRGDHNRSSSRGFPADVIPSIVIPYEDMQTNTEQAFRVREYCAYMMDGFLTMYSLDCFVFRNVSCQSHTDE